MAFAGALFADFLVLWWVCRLMAGRSVSEYKLHFMIVVCFLLVLSLMLPRWDLSLAESTAIYFIAAGAALHQLIGTSILGSLVGSALFCAYKAVVFYFGERIAQWVTG